MDNNTWFRIHIRANHYVHSYRDLTEDLSAVMRESMFLSILFVAVFLACSPPLPLHGATTHSETIIRSSAYSGGNTIIKNGVVSTTTGTASARAIVIVNGETIFDVSTTSKDGTPVSIQVAYPATKPAKVTTATTSSTQLVKEAVAYRTPPPVAPMRTRGWDVDAHRTSLPVLLPAPGQSEHIINVTSENTDTVRAPKEVDVPDIQTPTTLWTRMFLSFAHTITYVTSFFFP